MTQLISVGVGQCGVQMASSFIDYYMTEASTHISADACSRFFFETKEKKYVSRCVLIDTENKAVSELVKERTGSSNWKYDRQSIWAQGCGSGNNWAYGYEQNGFAAKNEVMDRMQHQAEKCDRFGGFVMFQSLAGGTGSGLGSRITECVRDAFGHNAHIMNNVVWPYKAGEVQVQSYNSVLSLSTLLKNSDAVVVTYNDVLHEICSDVKGAENVSFADMNTIIAQDLTGMFLPSKSICSVPLLSQPLSHLVPIQSRRLLSLFSLPIVSDVARGFSIFNWDTLVGNCLAMTATGNFAGKNVPTMRRVTDPRGSLMLKSDAVWIVLRGNELADGKAKVDQCELLKCGRFFPSDNDDPVLLSTNTRQFNKQEKSINILANSQCVINPLNELLDKCHNMLESAAYLHQYLKAGVDADWINEDRLFLEQVLHEYQQM
ncbi:Tubulin delta chain [Tritrichomonas musculus]|uniref:Tubulin delta chain n=1 Tax=Tritrichomonas musculus TaxID=1915356 RepID=A0ABR2KEC3_9EUKA